MARKWWTLIAVSVATFMLLLDITVVNVALPSIREDLGASFSDLQWVVDAYALTLAALVLSAGSLADRVGRRRVFTAGLAIFSVASLLCALAPDPTFLNLSRALQGVGGAVMFAVSLALIAQEFPAGRERATAMGAYGATIGVAVAIGPLIGGALTDGLGWQSIFYLNVPIGLAAIAITRAKLRESRDPHATRVDWPGVVTFTGALFMLVLALVRGNDEGWGSTMIVSLLAGRGGADGRLRRGREPRPRADAAARPLPAGLLHRSPAGGIRALGLGLRALPLHQPLPAGLPRLLALRGGAALPADHGGDVPRRAGRRVPAHEGPGAGAARIRPRDGGGRAAADVGGRAPARSGRRCSPDS